MPAVAGNIDVNLELIHYTYMFVIFVVFLFLITGRQITSVTLSGTFFIGFIYYQNSVIGGLQTVFLSMVVAGKELFEIIMLITVMVALLEALKAVRADNYMVAPFKILFINPTISFWVLGMIMYVMSLVFWPTPATALVASVLAPAAIKSGLSPLACAVSINLLGHGMALSGDIILQATSGLSEKAAGLEKGSISHEAMILSIVTGIIAVTLSFLRLKSRSEFLKDELDDGEIIGIIKKTEGRGEDKGKALAVIVILVFSIVVYFLYRYELKGDEASSFMGGVSVFLMLLATLFENKKDWMKLAVEHLKSGFSFAMKIFGPVIPIAGFFFLGSDKSEFILGDSVSPLLLDLAWYYMDWVPATPIFLASGNLLIGIISGLDGSGFSGLSMTGTLAAALTIEGNYSVEPLIAIGQMGSVWCGGGTIISWSFGLLTTAGLLNVDPVKLAKINFIPVILGLIVSTLVSIILMLT